MRIMGLQEYSELVSGSICRAIHGSSRQKMPRVQFAVEPSDSCEHHLITNVHALRKSRSAWLVFGKISHFW